MQVNVTSSSSIGMTLIKLEGHSPLTNPLTKFVTLSTQRSTALLKTNILFKSTALVASESQLAERRDEYREDFMNPEACSCSAPL